VATWSRTGDDGVKESGLWDGKSPLTVKTRLARAGFVRLLVEPRWTASGERWRVEGAGSDVFFDGGAAADVAKLKQAKPEPEDFDQFWKSCRDELDALPMTANLEEIPSTQAEVKLFKIKVSCPGGSGVTSGFLSVPKSRGNTGRSQTSSDTTKAGRKRRTCRQNPRRQIPSIFTSARTATNFAVKTDTMRN
jgi:hypothetical protein